MIEKHDQEMKTYQKKIEDDMLSKPPRWSRELIQWYGLYFIVFIGSKYI